MKYNRLFESHFQGCLRLAGYQDPHRKREVGVFMIPGDHSMVGISDGVDAWVAPVNTTVAGINLSELLEAVRAGTFTGAAPTKTFRRPFRVDALAVPTEAVPEAKTTRRRMINV